MSEADIQAYVDGELTPERARRLRRYLRAEAGEARRVAFYDALNAQLRRRFPPADAAALRDAAGASDASGVSGASDVWDASRAHASARTGARRALRVAFAALGVALTAAGGWLAAAQVAPPMLDDAAVMALIRAQSAPATGAITQPGRAPADAGAPNLRAAGMRVVATETVALGPVARVLEYVYTNRDGQPVVLLCAWAWTARAQPQWRARRVGPLRLLAWTRGRRRYVLAGAARTHDLMRAADLLTLQQ